MRRRPLLLLTLLLLAMLAVGPAALAHSGLQSTRPPANAVLNASPEQVVLQFSGKVTVPSDGVTVTDAAGARLQHGQAAVDPADGARVALPLPALKAGRYAVTWRVLSADGHPMTGSFGFTVAGDATGPAGQAQAGQAQAGQAPGGQAPGGQAPGGQALAGQPSAGQIPGGETPRPGPPHPPVAFAAPDDPPSAGAAIGYWFTVAGLMVLTGLALVQGWLAPPGPAAPGYARLLQAGWAAALGGTLLLLIARTAQIQGLPAIAVLTRPAALWQTLTLSTGPAMLARLLLLAVAAPALPLLTRRWAVAAATGAAGLLTLALGGHAVAVKTPAFGVALDWLHLLAASAWAGGLLQFALLLRGPDLGARIKRFSVLAAASVAVLTGTGLYPALLHVPTGEALLSTIYGLSLLTKLVLVLLLLGLGAANLLVVGPALRRGEPLGARFRWLVGVEVTLVAGVLAVTAVLTNAAPAREVLRPKVLYIGGHSKHHEYVASMMPLAPGTRTLDLWLSPHEGAAGPELLAVLTVEQAGGKNRFGPMLGHYVGAGVYRFEGVELPVAGDYAVTVMVGYRGGEPDKIWVPLTVPEGP